MCSRLLEAKMWHSEEILYFFNYKAKKSTLHSFALVMVVHHSKNIVITMHSYVMCFLLMVFYFSSRE